MKLLTNPVVNAFGLAMLCCLELLGRPLSPRHLWLYHASGSPRTVFLAILADIALVWIGLTLLVSLAARVAALRLFIWTSLAFFVPWLLVLDGTLLDAWNPAASLSGSFIGSTPAQFNRAFLLATAIAWLATLAMLFRSPKLQTRFEQAQRFLSTVLGFAALSGVLTLGQFFWTMASARGLNSARPLRQASATLPTKPRILWIILDELSYQQLYEHRFPGLALPAFDRLAQQSTVFTHVLPAGTATQEIVLSLLTGDPITGIRVSTSGDLLATRWAADPPSRPASHTFNPDDAIFQDALDAGYRTAVAGWYNPYCRILPQVLDRCFWTDQIGTTAGMRGEASILQNIAAPWLLIASAVSRRAGKPREHRDLSGEAHLSDYRELLAAGDLLLQDPANTFVLLHIPIPHPNGIYNRATGEFSSAGTSYIDNLALADHYLAHIRTLLEQQGHWDDTTILLMGDHSWRTTLIWMSASEWTAEDAKASTAAGPTGFDDRPAYLLKLPDQSEPASIDQPFPALATRALLQQLIKGQIGTPADLARFAASLPPPAPP